MIKAVILDIDNTLLSFDAYVKYAMKNGFEKFGIGPYRESMYPVFHRINLGLWEAIERNEITFEELQKIRWNKVFQALGISADGPAFETYFRECLFENAIPVEGAEELLQYLHRKYLLFAASNGPYHQQVNRLRIAGMLPFFSQLFISEEMGCSKPSEQFFQMCLLCINQKAGDLVRPEEIMVIGDSITADINGGRQAGMKTCLYNPEKRTIPFDQKPDHEVMILEEVQTFL